MINLKRILHPTDFSENSSKALEYAAAFASHFDAEVHLLHVMADPILTMSTSFAGYLPEGYFVEMRKDAEKRLADMAAEEPLQSIRSVQKVVDGSAFSEIIRFARDNTIDMIILGTHGHSGLMHLLMGSVAENVVRKASCPVLTVHPDDHQFVMP